MINSYGMLERDAFEKVKALSDKCKEKTASGKITNEELFKIRYAQMIQGLMLQNDMKKYF